MVPNHPTNPTWVHKNNRQIILTQVTVNRDNNSKPHKQVYSHTHIVVQYIVATHKPTLRIYNKFMTTTTYIVVKLVYIELVKRDIPINMRNTETIGIQAKLFPSRFRIWHPVFHTNSNLSEKYKNEQVKCRNRGGTRRDLSRQFSTLLRQIFAIKNMYRSTKYR